MPCWLVFRINLICFMNGRNYRGCWIFVFVWGIWCGDWDGKIPIYVAQGLPSNWRSHLTEKEKEKVSYNRSRHRDQDWKVVVEIQRDRGSAIVRSYHHLVCFGIRDTPKSDADLPACAYGDALLKDNKGFQKRSFKEVQVFGQVKRRCSGICCLDATVSQPWSCPKPIRFCDADDLDSILRIADSSKWGWVLGAVS